MRCAGICPMCFFLSCFGRCWVDACFIHDRHGWEGLVMQANLNMDMTAAVLKKQEPHGASRIRKSCQVEI
jgi:hypothetical protein